MHKKEGKKFQLIVVSYAQNSKQVKETVEVLINKSTHNATIVPDFLSQTFWVMIATTLEIASSTL